MAGNGKRIRKVMNSLSNEAETSSATHSSSTTTYIPSHHQHDATPGDGWDGSENQLPDQNPKSGRGRSKQTPSWDSGVKLQVHLTSDGRIDGFDRVKFKTQLGVIARNPIKFPVTCKSFKEIGECTKNNVWCNIKENTTLPDEAKDVVFEDINIKWKQAKSRLKRKFFAPYEDDDKRKEELEKNCVPPDQVNSIVDQWNLPETQEVARRNASNIAQYKFHHRLGRKPILELEKEFLAKGKVPSKIDIFVTSRAPNGKPPVNDHTIGRINSLIDKATQVSDGERTRESDDIVWIEEMGVDGHGRVKAAGQGVKPSKHRHSWTSSLNDAIKEKIREEVSEELKEEMREEREQMKREFELMREEREQMREFMNQMTQNMAHAQAVASHTRNEMTQTVVEEVVSYFGLGQFPISPFISSTAPLRSATAPLRGPAAPSKQFAPLRPATAPLRGPAAPSKQFAPSSSFNMRQVQGGVSTHGAAHIAPLKPFPSSFRPFDMRQVHDRASTYGASASETSSEI